MTSPLARTSRPRTHWDQGRTPGREVAALLVAVLLTVVVVDLLLSARLGLLFDLGFVTLCLRAAIAVRPGDFFAVSVLPPLAMLAVIGLLAAADPGAVAHGEDGLVQATVSGLSAHAVALAVGYGLCLAVLGVRRQVAAPQAD